MREKNRSANLHRLFIKIVIAAAIVNSFVTVGFGQGAQHTENKADQVLRSSGRVNPSTLGMEIDIPLGSYPGRGINVPVSLSYSSKLWRMDYVRHRPTINNPDDCRAVHTAKFSENSASGWTTSLAAPFIEYTGHDNTFTVDGHPSGSYPEFCQVDPPPPPPTLIIKRITIHLLGGESHELRDEIGGTSGSFPQNFNGTYYAADGSNIKYIQNTATGTFRLLMPDGSFYDFVNTTTLLNQATVRKANKFTDRNGNFTTYHEPNTTYPNGYWTDTIGRIIPAPFGLTTPAAPTIQNYQMPGMTGNYKFHWKQLKGNAAAESGLTDFSQALRYHGDKYTSNNQLLTHPAGTTLFTSPLGSIVWGLSYFNPIVLTEIELPTGQSYKFTYDIYGKIERIYYPTGGEERFEYDVVPMLAPSEPGDVNPQTNFGVKKRQVFVTSGQGTPVEWNYNAVYVAPAGYKVTTVAPNSTSSERYLYQGDNSSGGTVGNFGYDNPLAGMAYDERALSSTGQLLTRKLISWTYSQIAWTVSSTPRSWHPRVTREEAVVYGSSGNGLAANTTFEYEGDLSLRETPVLMRKSAQYGFVTVNSGTTFPTALPANPLNSAETTFLINDANYAQATRDVYKNQNMVGLATVSKIKDAAGTIVAQSETVYDESGYSPNVGRGNPTAGRVWDSTKGAVSNPSAYIVTRAKFDSYGNLVEATDAKGNTTFTEYSSAYQYAFPTKVTSPVPDSGQHGSNVAFVTTTTYDPTTGLPLSSTDANGQTTTMEYDPVTLRPKKATPPAGSGVAETIYNDQPNNYWIKNKAQIEADKWVEATTYFDGLGRAVKSEKVDSNGNIFTETEYDNLGRVKRVTNPYRTGETKQWTTTDYDDLSRVIRITTPDTAKVETDYGISSAGTIGTTKTVTDQAGKKRRGVSDALGRMTRVVEDPTGQNLSTDYTFDALGNLRKTVQGGQSRYFLHDSLGRLLYSKQPEQDANASFATTDAITGNISWSVKYEYDNNSNITKTTDARGVYVEGSYDNLNRLKLRNYSDNTPDVELYYDGKYVDVNGVAQQATGSTKGRTTGVRSSVSTANQIAFDYLGRILESEQITDGKSYRMGYSYNLAGAMVSERYPSGRIVRHEFDADGDLAKVLSLKGGAGRTFASNFTYTSTGAVSAMQLGNGRWETAAYNNRLQITQIGLGTTSAVKDLLKLEYSYGSATNNNGSLREQKISFAGLAQPMIQTYTYDDLNRLQSAVETFNGGTQSWKQTFQYDRFANRRFDTANNNTTTLVSGCPTAQCNPLINTATNRFSNGQGYNYDANGNLTVDAEGKQFLYDAENHQKSFGTGGSNINGGQYFYDGAGKRVKKIIGTLETIFVYDANGILVAEYENIAPPAAPNTKYLTQDHLGSPRIVTDETGAEISRHDYHAFGEEIYAGVANRTTTNKYSSFDDISKQFATYERDTESGLDFAQARYYNSKHGRFTSVDPLTASANVRNPQTFNRYSYVLNSPYKFVDPLGLISQNAGSPTGTCFQCVDGSAFSGRDSSFDWAREEFGSVVGYGLDQPDGSTVINDLVVPASQGNSVRSTETTANTPNIYIMAYGQPGTRRINTGTNFKRATETAQSNAESHGDTVYNVGEISSFSGFQNMLDYAAKMKATGIFIFAHGASDAIDLGDGPRNDRKDITMTNVGTLKNRGFTGVIYIKACNTGSTDNGIAATLSKQLGVQVEAPTTGMSFSPDPYKLDGSKEHPSTGPTYMVPEGKGTYRHFFPRK